MLWTLNRFTSMREACTVPGGQHRELTSHITFHSNKFACGHLEDNNVTDFSSNLFPWKQPKPVFIEYKQFLIMTAFHIFHYSLIDFTCTMMKSHLHYIWYCQYLISSLVKFFQLHYRYTKYAFEDIDLVALSNFLHE